MSFNDEYCHKCHDNPASVKIVAQQDGEIEQVFLCASCYAKANLFQKYNYPVSLYSIFKGFLPDESNHDRMQQNEYEKIICSNCSTTFLEVLTSGKVGCPQCYLFFQRQLSEIFSKIQKKEYHRGKIPPAFEELYQAKQNIIHLQDILKKAVKNEEFQQALDIRKKIEEEKAHLHELYNEDELT